MKNLTKELMDQESIITGRLLPILLCESFSLSERDYGETHPPGALKGHSPLLHCEIEERCDDGQTDGEVFGQVISLDRRGSFFAPLASKSVGSLAEKELLFACEY